MVTPRERETWQREVMFTSLYSLTLDVHVTVRVVLDIKQFLFFFFFFAHPPLNIGGQNPTNTSVG
jgi:hypothetical protein